MREYDRIAAWYAETRSDIGLRDVTALARTLPSGAKVLDAGCGTGAPIAAELLRLGFDVYGIDSSAAMIRRFRANCPAAHAQHSTLAGSDLFGESFDAVIAWGVLFHLDPRDQELAIAKLAGALKPGGTLLFTAGRDEGSVDGEMNGVPFRYVSLGSARYRAVAAANALTVVDEHFDEGENYVYVAARA